MIKENINSLVTWRFNNLSKHGRIKHFITGREGGVSGPPYDSLNLGFNTQDVAEKVKKNWALLSSAMNISIDNFYIADQKHDNNVIVVNKKSEKNIHYTPSSAGVADAMITNIPGIYLTILVADCAPILFFDPVTKAIGIAHAGWRGTVELIAQNTALMLQKEYGAKFHDIVVGIGPSISVTHLEVGTDVTERVERRFKQKRIYIRQGAHESKCLFDLWGGNKTQLIELGIREENIELSDICTYEDHSYFYSARYDKNKTGRFGAGIMLSED